MHELYTQILNELRSAWRFRWLALATSWAICLAGWYWVVTQPDVYQASALIYVDTTSELRRLLGNQIVEQDVTAQLNFVRQSMLGQVQLEQVASSTGLDAGATNPDDRQRIVANLRSAIQIESGGGTRTTIDNIYNLRYQHMDRQVAIRVVRELVNIFVDGTVGANREGAESARRFLEKQVQDYEARLAEAEQRLAQFRRENFDRLPGSQGGYFQRLQSETAQMEETRKQLDLARSRRDRILQRLRGEAPAVGDGVLLGDSGGGSTIAVRIREHESRLEELLLRFTPRHPDVAATREALEDLREQRAAQLALLAQSDQESGPIASNNPVYQALQISMNEAEVEIATLEADLADRQSRVSRLQNLIEEVPEVEAQLVRLDRDYEIVHGQYQTLVQSLERERLSRGAHETEHVEFRVVNPPAASDVPVAPNRPRLLAVVLLAAVAAGGGIGYLLAQLQPVFHTPRMLREITGVPVLGAVSLTFSRLHAARRHLAVVGFVLAGSALVAAFAGILVVEINGPGVLVLLERVL